MKKVALLFSALALVLGLSQCKKVRPDMPHYSGSVGDKYIQEVKLTAAYPKGNSKVSVEDDATSLLKLKWQIGDELTVGGTGAGSKNLKCTSVSEDGLTGTFEGIITASEGTVTFTYGSKPTPYENQVGTLEGLKNLVCLEGSATFNQDGNYNNVPMKLPYAILKLDLSALGSADGNTVTVKVASETKASVLNVTNTATGLYVALPTENEYDAPDPTEETYTFEGNDKSVDKVLTIKKSVYYTKSGSSTGDPIEVKPEPSYVCFEAVEAGSTVYLAGLFAPPSNMSISTDGGNTWADFSAPVTLSNVGDKCYFKSKTKRDKVTDSWGISCKFSGSGNIKVSGNIMALLDGNNPASEMTEDNAGCFQQLFQNCAATIDASELVLPATTLAANCYMSMFSKCSKLEKAPDLPATTLAANCYNDMFKNCTSLVDASNITLSATTLAEGCYQQMFDGCTNLVTAPVLKAETFASNSCNLMFSDCSSLKETPAMTIKAVADNCCSNMFCGCTSLEDASNISLSATKLAANCYFGMFGFSSTSACCSSLKKAPAMSATEAANNCCEQMFKDCKSLVDVSGITFATTLADDCYNCMFEGCSSLETAPASLPATTLKKNCYIGMFTNCTSLKTVPDMSAIETVATNCCDAMFRGCTSLETAPDLKAATLAPNCYYQMFCGCSKLTTAPAISATTLATYCCGSMFYGCTSLETAPELKATTLVEGCYYSIFYGCAKLSSVTMLATDINATNCLNTWLGYDSGTAGTSTASPKVYVASGMKNAVEGTVPFNWTVEVKP